MAIEIRQLVVKSNLVQREANEQPAQDRAALEKLKETLRAECRQMVEDALRNLQER